jgi:hypothetical protein
MITYTMRSNVSGYTVAANEVCTNNIVCRLYTSIFLEIVRLEHAIVVWSLRLFFVVVGSRPGRHNFFQYFFFFFFHVFDDNSFIMNENFCRLVVQFLQGIIFYFFLLFFLLFFPTVFMNISINLS